MFPIIDRFIEESRSFLSKLQTPEEIADGCIRLLKGNDLLQLSAHEFAYWLAETKTYIEKGKEDPSKKETIENLLKAEIVYRKNQPHIPVFTAYGSLEKGSKPQIRLLPMSRIETGIINARGFCRWDENLSVSDIIRLKDPKALVEDYIERPYEFDGSKVILKSLGNPYMIVKRSLNAKAPEPYRIKSKQEADQLTRYLAKLKPFSWNDYITCEIRAQGACEYLEGYGIDPETLTYVHIGRTSSLDKRKAILFEDFQWSYHRALAISTLAGELFVLDPATHPSEALEPRAWAAIYGKDLTIEKESVLNMNWKELSCPSRYDFNPPQTVFGVLDGDRMPELDPETPS